MRMKSCLDFILPLFLLWGITACSAPADKDMLEYEHSLAHADSLVQSGVADSARTARLLSGLHREYARVKEQSAGKPLRLMPVTGWKHTLWGVFGALMLGLNVWLSIRDIKFTNERKHRRYLINLSENERHLHNNECERAELEECLKEMSLEDDEREEVQRSLVNLMTRGSRLHEENGVLRGRLREYEDHPVPYELELLQKEGERARKLDGQVQALTAALIDRDEVVERLRAHPKFLTEAQWEHLRQLTDKAYTGISERLIFRFPQLTPADLQLCLLIRLRFTNTQIADDIVQNADTFLDLCRAGSRSIELNEVVESFSHFLDLVCKSLLSCILYFCHSTAKASDKLFCFLYGCCSLVIFDLCIHNKC